MIRKRYKIIIWIIVAIPFLIILTGLLGVIFWLGTSGEGYSVEEALRMRATLEAITDLEGSALTDPEFSYQKFQNGEWAMGIGHDSHAFMSKYNGGGIVVIKDSKGEIRYFYGHVCGPCGLEGYLKRPSIKSLDEFYNSLCEGNMFIEQKWP